MPAGAQHAEDFGDGFALVRREIEHSVTGDHIDACGGQRKGFYAGLDHFHIADSVPRRQLAQPAGHGRGNIHREDLSPRSHKARRDQRIGARAGADVEDRVALADHARAERTPHPGKRLERFFGKVFQQIFGIAHQEASLASDGKMERTPRGNRHRRIHIAHSRDNFLAREPEYGNHIILKTGR